jgi:hypothetical protein
MSVKRTENKVQYHLQHGRGENKASNVRFSLFGATRTDAPASLLRGAVARRFSPTAWALSKAGVYSFLTDRDPLINMHHATTGNSLSHAKGDSYRARQLRGRGNMQSASHSQRLQDGGSRWRT